ASVWPVTLAVAKLAASPPLRPSEASASPGSVAPGSSDASPAALDCALALRAQAKFSRVVTTAPSCDHVSASARTASALGAICEMIASPDGGARLAGMTGAMYGAPSICGSANKLPTSPEARTSSRDAGSAVTIGTDENFENNDMIELRVAPQASGAK